MPIPAAEEAILTAAAKGLLSPLPAEIGLALILFGSFSAQVYSYWINYGKDKGPIKAMVLTLLTFECLHTAACFHMMQWYFIDQIANPAGVLNIVWTVAAAVSLEITIIGICQLFYIYRLWKFSGGNLLVTLIPLFLLVARVGLTVVNIIFLVILKTWQNFHDNTAARLSMTVSLSFGVITDVVITACMMYYLHKHKSTFRRTQHMIQHLMYYTINTGSLTTVFSIVTLVTYNVLPKALVFGGLIQLLSKLYANSVMAMLNARHFLQKKGAASTTFNTIPLEFRHGMSKTDASGGSTTQGDPEGVHIKIFKNTTTDTEGSLGTITKAEAMAEC